MILEEELFEEGGLDLRKAEEDVEFWFDSRVVNNEALVVDDAATVFLSGL